MWERVMITALIHIREEYTSIWAAHVQVSINAVTGAALSCIIALTLQVAGIAALDFIVALATNVAVIRVTVIFALPCVFHAADVIWKRVFITALVHILAKTGLVWAALIKVLFDVAIGAALYWIKFFTAVYWTALVIWLRITACVWVPAWIVWEVTTARVWIPEGVATARIFRL